MGGSFKYLQNAEPDGKNDKKRLLNGEKTSPFGVMMLFWARDYEYSNERSIVFLKRLQYLLCRWGSFPSGRWRDVEGISRPWTSQSERGCCGNTKLMQTTLQASFDTAHGFKSASHFHTGRLRHAEPVCRLRTLFPVSCFFKEGDKFWPRGEDRYRKLSGLERIQGHGGRVGLFKDSSHAMKDMDVFNGTCGRWL